MRWFNKQTLDGLSSNAINAIAEDQSGRVWLATDLGVNLISPEREEVQKLYVENGLLSNTVTGVVVDEAGDVWVSTNRGINRIQSSSLVISSFDHSDGLMSDFYGRQAIFKDEHGALYFGGNKGIDIIKPMAVTKNARKPNIALTKFNLFNVEQRPGQSKILTQPVYATKQVRLNHNHSVFSLEFVALDQTAPDKNQYAFYLQGFDLGWQQVGAQRTATYTNLPAGDYVFHVKGTNNDGVWSEPLRLGIHIAAAPWKSTWAYSIYLLALISAIYLFIQVKLKRQAEALALANAREEKQRLKENFEMEQRFTANVAHELRTPLAELINMSEVALMWPDDAEIREGFYQDVLDSATQMHQVVNNLLALARCERGLIRLKLSQLDLLDEIAHAWARHQSYWSKKAISLEVTGADDWHLAGHQAELALILNNIISNAIEYAPTGSAVTIEVDKDSNAIRCCNRMVNPLSPEEIPFIFQRLWRKDGSSAYSEHAGLGMPLIKAYAEIIQLQVEVQLIEDRFVLTLSGLAKD